MVTIEEHELAGDIHFFDNYIPSLPDGTYKVDVQQQVTSTHKLTHPPGRAVWSSYTDSPKQTFALSGADAPSFVIRGPRFALDSSMVHAVHPSTGANGDFRNLLPHLTLNREILPWERLLRDTRASDPARPPWVALLVFPEGELRPGAEVGDMVTSRTVTQLLTPAERDVAVPGIDRASVPDELLASTCRTIDVRKDAFMAAVPRRAELRFLAHVRRVETNLPDGPETEEFAVVVANRFPRENARYHAHLVSLEGLEDCVDGKAPSADYVRLISLWGWQFSTHATTPHTFGELVGGLKTSVAGLCLPGTGLPDTSPGARAKTRLASGYVPLGSVTGTGERTFAWYRGPFTPVTVADPQPAKERPYRSADEALVYIQPEGIFDVSYAAAWTYGRFLALAHADLSAPVLRAQASVTRQTARMRMALPQVEALTEQEAAQEGTAERLLREQLHPQRARGRFEALVAGGLGERLGTALAASPPQEERAVAGPVESPPAAVPQPAPPPAELLSRSDVRSVVKEALREELARHSPRPRRGTTGQRAVPAGAPGILGASEQSQPEPTTASWDSVALLSLLSADVLLPHAGLVPPESLRFFSVDPHWVDALVDGVVSIGVTTSLDEEARSLVREVIAPKDTGRITGLVLRSGLIDEWPGFLLAAYQNNRPLPLLRRDPIGPGMLLFLFDGMPDNVDIWEPVHELSLGLRSDGTCAVRRVVEGPQNQFAGELLADTTVEVAYRSPGAAPVLDVTELVSKLGEKVPDLRKLQDPVLSPASFSLQLMTSAYRLSIVR
ncbi:hypothetical protein [Streptomyces murinus]|uniref:hypothetical protein n=1 Tax=Streptomyces murinus TaxID=33900 RepID=UPI003F452F9D